MDESKPHVERLLNDSLKYLENTLKYLKLEVIEGVSMAYARIWVFLFFVVIFTALLLFASITAALLIGHYFLNIYLGFAVVTGCWIVLAAIFFFFRRQLVERPLINHFIKKYIYESKR